MIYESLFVFQFKFVSQNTRFLIELYEEKIYLSVLLRTPCGQHSKNVRPARWMRRFWHKLYNFKTRLLTCVENAHKWNVSISHRKWTFSFICFIFIFCVFECSRLLSYIISWQKFNKTIVWWINDEHCQQASTSLLPKFLVRITPIFRLLSKADHRSYLRRITHIHISHCNLMCTSSLPLKQRFEKNELLISKLIKCNLHLKDLHENVSEMCSTT